MRPKVTLVPEGFTGALLLEGKVAVAVQQISELELAGATNIVPLPDAVQSRTTFTTAILSGASHADAAADIVAILASAGAAEADVRSGVEPLFELPAQHCAAPLGTRQPPPSAITRSAPVGPQVPGP